jgi:serine/threonine protein phosphatase 1
MENEIFVHANLEPGVPLDQQTAEWLRWVRFIGFEEPHSSGKRIICGHTPQPDGAPAITDGWVCLDTWAYNGSFLSAMDVETNVVYQAKQTGEYRERALSEFAQRESAG